MKTFVPLALMASAGLVGAVSESKCAVCPPRPSTFTTQC